jgi:hypothetical protein
VSNFIVNNFTYNWELATAPPLLGPRWAGQRAVTVPYRAGRR